MSNRIASLLFAAVLAFTVTPGVAQTSAEPAATSAPVDTGKGGMDDIPDPLGSVGQEIAAFAIVAAIFAIFGAFIIRWRERVRDRRALAAGLAGEIEVMIDISEKFRHEDILRRCIDLYKKGEDEKMPRFEHDDTPPYELMKMYAFADRNLEKFVILGPALAGRAMYFYTYSVSIRREYLAIARGVSDDWSLDRKHAVLTEFLKSVVESKELGRLLVGDLLAMAKPELGAGIRGVRGANYKDEPLG